MKRILISLVTILTVSGATFAFTQGFFSDSEVSAGNVLEAGAIDLKIDNTSYLNGAQNAGTTWELADLDDGAGPAAGQYLFFNFDDLKPGDWGEDTISLHVDSNDAWACVTIDTLVDNENACTEPEDDLDATCADPGPGDGELSQELNFIFWADDGDNVLETDETVLTEGPAIDILDGVTWTLADSTANVFGTPGPLDGGVDPTGGNIIYHIGKAWCYGALTQTPADPGDGDPTANPGITCDGEPVTNISQTDSLTGNITFYAEQARNNDDFTCASL